MAAKTFAELLTKFNTRLRDSSDVTFSSSEKTEMLTEAFNDPYVYTASRDTSLTTIASQANYTLPTGIEAVLELGIDINADGYYTKIDSSAYDVADGVISFSPEYKGLFSGKTLLIIGKKKLATTDTIPDKIQDYVLHLAMITAFETLITSFSTTFLTNDASMSDLQAAVARHERKAAQLRSSIINQHSQVF
jgi:hypothetical protein